MKPASQPQLQPDLFPSFDSIEAVLWPAAALAVFVVTAVLVDLMVILAARWRLVDLPNRRSAHALPTARGGGLAIVLTTALASIMVALRWPPAAFGILAGMILPCLVIAVVGIIDDMQPLRASLRLFIQIGVAAAITAALGPLTTIQIPGLPAVALGWAGWPLTVVWIVGMTNAFNFMDGSDGMAALGAVVAGVLMAAIGWQLKIHLPLLMAAFTAAAAGGFLVFNWQPARVFMGDVGSAFLGTYLAAVPLAFPEPQRSLVFIPMVLALWPYVFDPFVSVLRRVYHRRNPFEPHREFLFHRLIRSGIGHGPAALLYAVLAAVGGLIGILMVGRLLPDAVRASGPLLVIAMAGGLAWAIERRCARVGLPSAAGPPAGTAAVSISEAGTATDPRATAR